MTKHVYTGILCLLFLVLGTASSLQADGKTLYVARHSSGVGEGNIYAFEIDQDELVFQSQVTVTSHGYGAVDLAIDDSSDTLFVSFENGNGGGNVIELVNSKTMLSQGNITLEGPTNLTGIVFDSTRKKLYGTDRNSDRLYAYSWNATTSTMTADPCNPIELDNISRACGLALDGNVLYVSEYNYSGLPTFEKVQMYDVSDDWNHLGSHNMGNKTVGIDYDSTDDILYGGAYDYYGTYHHLIKHNTDPNNTIEKDIGTNATAVAVNDSTGLVYITTYRSDPCSQDAGSIEVYDTSNWTSDPNQSISAEFTYQSSSGDGIAIANLAGLTIGGPYKPPIIKLLKKDDVASYAYPEGEGDPCYFEYTICYDPNNTAYTTVRLQDKHPYEVFPRDANSLIYNFMTRTVYWILDDIDDTDPCACVSFDVEVMPWAEPCSVITNTAILETDTSYDTVTLDTKIGCWGGDIIYVDATADGSNIGTSWEDAYVLLQDALERAEKGCGDEIWVAQGTYAPGDTSSNTFALHNGVEVYGGFAGTETSRSQRDFLLYRTILTGNNTCSKVVTTESGAGSSTILDGFTVEDATTYGIYVNSADINVANCVVQDNDDDGIYSNNGEPTITDCLVKSNGDNGMECRGSSESPTIIRCNVYGNTDCGIYAQDAYPAVTNSIIHHNGEDGVYLYGPDASAEIRNNTICYNSGYGVKTDGGTDPDIRNCILWDNTTASVSDWSLPTYCCINDPNSQQCYSNPDDSYNITCDPCFAYDADQLYDFHIKAASPCVDRGDNTNVDPCEVDIDGGDRIEDGDGDQTETVDMGAYEVWCDVTGHECDVNTDGVINLPEFGCLAAAWQDNVDPNDPNVCDCDDDGNIDLIDLCCLAEVWLWQACYYGSDGDGWTGMEGIGDAPPPAAPLGGGGESMMMALPMEAATLDSTSTPSLPTEAAIRARAQQNRLAKIRRELSNYDPSLEQEVMQLRAIIDWLEDLWITDPDIQKQVDKDDFWKFVGQLELELDALITQLWKQYDSQQ